MDNLIKNRCYMCSAKLCLKDKRLKQEECPILKKAEKIVIDEFGDSKGELNLDSFTDIYKVHKFIRKRFMPKFFISVKEAVSRLKR